MGKNGQVQSIRGTELVRKLVEEGDRLFTVERARELAPSVGLAENYLRESLHYLARSGWVVRLRKGLYALSSSAPGVSPVHEFEIAMALVHPAAISHLSAVHHHGMTEQIPREIFVLTTTGATIPRSHDKKGASGGAVLIENVAYHFVQVKPDHYFGIEDVWVNDARVKMTDPERTVLDGLLAPEYCGGFAEVLHIFETHMSKLNLEKLISYALKLDGATIKRTGWILEQFGANAKIAKPLLDVPIKGYRILDPSGTHQGHCNIRWRIQENLPGNLKR